MTGKRLVELVMLLAGPVVFACDLRTAVPPTEEVLAPIDVEGWTITPKARVLGTHVRTCGSCFTHEYDSLSVFVELEVSRAGERPVDFPGEGLAYTHDGVGSQEEAAQVIEATTIEHCVSEDQGTVALRARGPYRRDGELDTWRVLTLADPPDLERARGPITPASTCEEALAASAARE